MDIDFSARLPNYINSIAWLGRRKEIIGSSAPRARLLVRLTQLAVAQFRHIMLDASALATDRETSMDSRLRFGLIGAGRIGPVHAESLAFRVPQAQLVAIADLNPQAAQPVAARCNIPRVLASGEQLIA